MIKCFLFSIYCRSILWLDPPSLSIFILINLDVVSIIHSFIQLTLLIFPLLLTFDRYHPTSTKALYTSSPSLVLNIISVPAPMKITLPSLSINSSSPHFTLPLPFVAIAILGPSTERCFSESPAPSLVRRTENSGMGGS